MLLVTLLFTALAASEARTLAPRPPSATKALELRGGAISGVSLCAAAAPAAAPSRTTKANIALGLNTFCSVTYGLLATLQPNAMLAIYGVTGTLDFMNPAFGVTQFLGGMHLAVAVRCLGTFGVPGLPKRDTKTTLQDMCALHGLAGVVAGFRQFKGSSSPVIGSVIMAGLAYWAQQDA